MNKVILMGRFTKDPELQTTTINGIHFSAFTLAVQRRFAKQGEERQTDFINCVAWRQTAEFICRYFIKGRLIVALGTLQEDSYEVNGKKERRTQVVVEEAYFAGEKT